MSIIVNYDVVINAGDNNVNGNDDANDDDGNDDHD